MIIRRPIISEKSLTLASKGWYTFSVSPDASKDQIARAVSKAYKVTVTSVRTVSMHGKVRRVGRYAKYVKKEDWKKAMVTLAKGQKIDMFEVAPTEQSQPEPKKEKSTK